MGKPRILIAGAGIGGIVAALALLQRGFEVALYRAGRRNCARLARACRSRRTARGCCAILACNAAMEAIASVPTAKDMRLFNTGQAWRVQDLGAKAVARFGSPYWLVHRGDFHAALVRGAAERAPGAVHVGARCIGFEQDADRRDAAAGESANACAGDALIGADGVHSRIRGHCSAMAAPRSPASWHGAASCRWNGCPRICASNMASPGSARTATS